MMPLGPPRAATMLMQHADAASPGLLRIEKVSSKLTTSAQTSSAAAGGPSSDRRASPRLQASSSCETIRSSPMLEGECWGPRHKKGSVKW